MRLLERLVGLETEYAVRFHCDAGAKPPPLTKALYKSLVAELKRRMPIVRATLKTEGIFLANGGAVWYEQPLRPDGALIEGSTPECRGARQLLLHQRAQDSLLAASALDIASHGEMTLCKCDRDAWGHTFGAQENYELTIATGWRYHAWRIGAWLLLPAVATTWLSLLLLFPVFALLLIPYYLLAAAIKLCVALYCRLSGGGPSERTRARIHRYLFGEPKEWPPSALYRTLWVLCAVICVPMGIPYLALMRLTCFYKVRKQLLPFLVSRAVISGSGRIDEAGKYLLASKASGIGAAATLFEIFGARAIFTFGPQLKATLIPTPQLWSRRQRLQISLGDSNMCEEAEYLRIGCTLLVLDAIEAGFIKSIPRLRRPMRALRRIIGDPSLGATVKTSQGPQTAIQIQRFYLKMCKSFLATCENVPGEAEDILRRWEQVLDVLEENPMQLVGRLDWVTKLYLLNECGKDAPWEVKKKIDLKYHELSPDGYHQRLAQAGMIQRMLSDEKIEAAQRNPPSETMAAVRARYIREFAGDASARSSWTWMTIEENKKRIRFARHLTSEAVE